MVTVKRMSAETYNMKDKRKYGVSFSKNIALKNIKGKTLWRLPNGLYVWKR